MVSIFESGLEEAIIECSNEHESWKDEAKINQQNLAKKGTLKNQGKKAQLQSKTEEKPVGKKAQIKDKAKNAKAVSKSKNPKTTATNKRPKSNIRTSKFNSKLSFQNSFTAAIAEKKCEDLSMVVGHSIYRKDADLNSRAVREAEKLREKNKKFRHLFQKDNYNTVKVHKSKASFDHNTSVIPPNYRKYSPTRTGGRERGLKAIYASPQTPGQSYINKRSLTREHSIEAIKDKRFKSGKWS